MKAFQLNLLLLNLQDAFQCKFLCKFNIRNGFLTNQMPSKALQSQKVNNKYFFVW